MARFTQMAPASSTARDGSGGAGGVGATPKTGGMRIPILGPRLAAGPRFFHGAKFAERPFHALLG